MAEQSDTMSATVPPVPITCVCGNQIGEEVYIQGIVLIHAGGGLWSDLRGHCAQCSEPFYWSIKARQIQRVIITRQTISSPDNAGGE